MAGDRKTPHSQQCRRRPWHEQCPGVGVSESASEASSRGSFTSADSQYLILKYKSILKGAND